MEVHDSQNLSAPSLSSLSDEPQQMEKLKPLELLKMKMCKSHDLIMNYNDKLKESMNLKTSLEQAQHKAKNMETKYMATLQKLINVELQNTDLRKSLEDSIKKVVDLETKTAGDQRLIQQLNCKIEDNDEKNADKLMDADLNKFKLEEKIKTLEQEIKTLKRLRPDKKKSRKNKAVNTEQVQIVDFDTSLNAEANLLENRLRESEFDESVEIKEENSSSILCAKCDAAFEKLINSFEAPEPLVTPILSLNPQLYPNEIQSHTEQISSMRCREVVEPEHLTDPPKETNLESETIKTLEKRVKNLERKIKKQNKIEDKNQCCHSNSSSYFPNPVNQDFILGMWKKLLDKDKPSHKRKCKKKLKRCENKRKVVSKKKEKRKSFQNWFVESSIQPDNLRQENLAIPSFMEKIISTGMNSEPQIKLNSLEERRQFPGPSKEKESISVNEFFEKNVSKKSTLPQVILEQESVLILEKSKGEEQTDITKENDFEMLEVSHDQISASSPNIEPPKIEETDIVSKEFSTLRQVIPDPEVSILYHKKEINATKENDFETLEVSHDKISASSPNMETPKIQETDIVSKEFSTLRQVIPDPEVSILYHKKEINATKENDFETLEVSHDKISASSPNIETPKIQETDIVSTEPSTLRKVIPDPGVSILNQEKEMKAIKENDFEMLEVNDDKISASSPNIKPPKIQETDIFLREPYTLRKVIPDPNESILDQEKRINATKENDFKTLEVSHDKISASSPNIDTPIQEKDLLREESRTSSKVIPGPKESLSRRIPFNQEKQTNSTNDFETLRVNHDKISASSPNIETLIQEKESPTSPKIPEPEESVLILEKSKENLTNSISSSSSNIMETLKIPGIQKEANEVLNKASISEGGRKILENRIQSVKRKASWLEESPDNINNLSVSGEHSRKMVRRRLSSHDSTDSLEIPPKINSSDFQSLHSENTCTNLVTDPEIGEGSEMPEDISEMDESSIIDQVQIVETIPSSEIDEELESTEEILQELTNSFDEKRRFDLLDELALSDDESPEEMKIKSSSSLEDTSHNFISNSNKKNSKNFIQGKRSSALLLTVISPVNQTKKKMKVDVKNSKPGNRGNLLTKIKALKRCTNKTVLTPIFKKSVIKKELKIDPKPEIKVNDESVASNSLMPTKKRRIAHTPKAESESGSVTSFEDFLLEIPIRKSLRSASKSPAKNKRIKSEEKKLDNSEEKEEKSPVRKKGRPKKVKVPEVNAVNLPKEAETEENFRLDVEGGKMPLNLSWDKSQTEGLIKKSAVQENSTLINNTSSDEDVALASRFEMKNEYWEKAKKVLESIKEKENSSEVRELRSRQVEVAAEENLGIPGIVKKNGKPKFLPVHPQNPILKSYYVMKLLNETFAEQPFVDLRQKSKLSQISLEKNVKLQLSRLIASETWTVELHLDVIKKICELCQASTAAKCIVSFLEKKFQEDEEPLDKSNTPPAPMMSRTQQKIITLISSLEKSMPNIFDLVSAGIDYSLLRLNEEHKDRNIIEGLARVYIVLARLKKDREKARLFCCDALYCLRNNAITVIYVVLTCWPEVFPICDTSPEILPKCMAHLILTTDGCGTKYPKVGALKNLISAYYQYPRAEYFSKQLAVEFLSALKQKHENSTDMAIILLAKKEGPDWTYKNIIQGGLLQMIVEKTHPSIYDAFSLLGNLMRTFPKEDKENYIGKTVQQLCDLLDSSQGTEDHLEGVATALLSLSKFTKDLDKVAKCLLLWKPNQTLRSETIVKFKFFFQSRSTAAWRDFIVNDYKNLTESRPNNNVHNKKPQLNNSQVQSKKKQNNRRRTKKANTSVKVPSNSKGFS